MLIYVLHILLVNSLIVQTDLKHLKFWMHYISYSSWHIYIRLSVVFLLLSSMVQWPSVRPRSEEITLYGLHRNSSLHLFHFPCFPSLYFKLSFSNVLSNQLCWIFQKIQTNWSKITDTVNCSIVQCNIHHNWVYQVLLTLQCLDIAMVTVLCMVLSLIFVWPKTKKHLNVMNKNFLITKSLHQNYSQ